MKRLIAGLFLVLAASVAFALPTVQQVEAETRAGNYTRAESMMSEVVAAKPGSAKAHYIYAELLAHNANFAKASEEAGKARQLDPALSFTDPEKFRTFEQTLQRALNPPARPRTTTAAPSQTSTAAPSQAAAPVRSAASSGIPGWVWPVGLAVVAFFLWRAFSRRREAGSTGPSANPGVSPMGYPPSQPPGGVGGGMGGVSPYGAPGVAPRAGSGMLGTGLAVAGGVAGGMLLDQMLNRHSDGGAAAGAGAGALGDWFPTAMPRRRRTAPRAISRIARSTSAAVATGIRAVAAPSIPATAVAGTDA